eukprot:gene7991-9525_t
MEDSKIALDSFLNSQSESVSSQVKISNSDQAKALYEAWERDFKSSSNILPTVTCGEHQSHDFPVAEEEDELEQITLDSNIEQNNSDILLRMGNNLKVDNFYVDGESDQLDDLEFSGYMPSGVNNSSLCDNVDEPVADHDGNVDYEDEAVVEDVRPRTIYTSDADDALSSQALSLSPQKQEHSNIQDSKESLTLSTTNMALLQRAYQAEQSRLIETLSCSESSVDDHDGVDDGDNENDTANLANFPSEESAMVEALQAFQEFSPRYRDIQASELLHTINNAHSTNIGTDDSGVEVQRWYDDVEEFVEE